MHERTKELALSGLKVGIVVTLAVVIIFLTVFFSEGILGFFRPKAPLVATIRDVGGLRTGSPVWLLGVEIGNVSDISLTREGSVVTLSILRKQLRLIHEDARATVRTMGLLGDKYVEISPGSLEAMNIEPGDTIPGGQTPGLESVIEASARSVQQVEQFVEEIENLVGLVRGGEGLIGGLLTDKELMGDFRRTVNALASVSSALDTGRGTLGKLVVDTALYHEVSVAVGRLGRMARLAASSRSTFHKVMTDTTIYRDLKATVGSLAALTDGNGGVTALLSDPQFAAKVRETVTIFNSLLEEIKANPEKYFNFELF